MSDKHFFNFDSIRCPDCNSPMTKVDNTREDIGPSGSVASTHYEWTDATESGNLYKCTNHKCNKLLLIPKS